MKKTKQAAAAATATVCPWESGQLGNDIRFARVAPTDLSAAVDKALGLVELSTRLPKKQAKAMEHAAKKSGLAFKAWLREALMEKLTAGKKKASKRK